MDEFIDDEMKHRKKRNKSAKKTNHRHQYTLVSKEKTLMKDGFIHTEVCDICGKVKKEMKVGDKTLWRM